MRLYRLAEVSAFVLLSQLLSGPVVAQDRTVLYNVSNPGVSKAISEWGLDTAWANSDNVRRGAVFMGTNEVDFVRVAFPMYQALTNGQLTANEKAEADFRVDIMNWAGLANKPLTMTPDTGRGDSDRGTGVASFFKSGSGVNTTNWVAGMVASVNYYTANKGKTIVSAAPFNEPDYGWDQGSISDLFAICSMLQTNPTFTTIALAGGSTLDCGYANTWYNPIKSVVEEGTTHQLGGSFDSYANFYTNVVGSGDKAVNEELHNVGEAIVGAEYGLQTGIWWGSAERTRAGFLKACQGMRLGYSEHRPNWTAASVYRAPSGAVQAFVGESERQALPTTYRFFSKDRDVFYDGYGPQRAYDVTTTGGPGYATSAHRNAERMVNITWGDDVQPAINGRYIIVARHSLKAMEVAGAGTINGANIQQNTYSGGTHQQWDVTPVPTTVRYGDYSYFSITAAHNGKAADVNFGAPWPNWGYNDGENVQLWDNGYGDNQQWFFEYVTNGWFYIRSRWSGKYLDVAGVSTADGANIQQWSGTGGLNQQWRLIPVGEDPADTNAPAIITGVNATANPRSIQLSWNISAATDLGGYSVLRSTNSGGPYQIIARGLTNNTFTDKSANLPIPYYFVVRAVDKSWNRSGNSTQVSATPTGSPSLIARYNFSGNMNDVSVNANHAIVTNGSPSFPSGANGTALGLNGVDQSIMLPANLFAGVSNYTIATWVYWSGTNNWQRIFDFGNDTKEYMFLTPRSDIGRIRFAVTTNSYQNNAEQAVEIPTPLPTNQWVHVAVTYDGSNATIYTNGVSAASGPISISPAIFNPTLNYLGRSQYAESFSDPLFNGRLDELSIYNYALSAGEIAQLVAPSALSIWDGGGADNNWSSALNWAGDFALPASSNAVVFAGSTRLTPNMNSSYSVTSLTFSNNAGAFTVGTSTGSTLTNGNGGIVNYSGNAQILNVPVVLNGAQTIDAAAGSLTLNSNLNAGSTILTVQGASNTTLAGAISGVTSLTKNGTGTLIVSASGNNLGGTMSVNAGAVNISGGSDTVANIHMATVTSGSLVGTIDITGSGVLNSGAETVLYDGQNGAVSGSGTLNVNSGVFSSEGDLILAFAGGGTGTVNVAVGGTVNVASATERWLIMNMWDTTKANLNINGGTLNLNANTDIRFSTGWYGPNTSLGQSAVTLNAGAIVGGATSVIDLNNNADNPVNNTLNLNGGTLTIGQIVSGKVNGSRVVNFNGGTLKPAAASTTFFTNGAASAANVLSGGAVFDTAGNSVTIAQPLLNGGGNGGLIKNSAGTLTMSSASTYTGETIINAGTLALTGGGSIGGSSAINVSSGAVFNVSGVSFTLGASQTLKGNGTVTGAATINGTITPGASIGTLTFGMPPVMNGTTLMEISRTNAPNADKVLLSGGTLTYGGVLIVTNIGGQLQAGDSFQLFSAPSYTGSFATTNLPTLGAGLAWSNALGVNGTISVVTTVSLLPTNIVLSLSGTNLTLSWPEDHKGWRLQGQTNGLTSTNWFDVPGANQTNMVLVPIVSGNGSVFYRLVYP